MNSDNNCRENLSYNSKFTSHFTFVYTCRNQGRINLARGPWHIFRAGPLALVVGVGGGGRGGTSGRVKGEIVSLRKLRVS